MDISEDYIYILVFIGLVVFNIVKTLRNGNNEKTSRPATCPTPSEYEEKEEIQDEWRSIVDSIPVPEDEPKPQLKSEMEPVLEEKMQRKSSSSISFEMETQESPRLELKTAEEARRAFLYSEIWNRKY